GARSRRSPPRGTPWSPATPYPAATRSRRRRCRRGGCARSGLAVRSGAAARACAEPTLGALRWEQGAARSAVDLNADLGEGVTDDPGLLAVVTSANVACGSHAG